MNVMNSTFSVVIKPKSFYDNYVFCKHIPEKDWPEYSVKCSFDLLAKYDRFSNP